MQQTATPSEPERGPYRWCPSCNELWAAARFDRTCPLCDGRTLAYVGRCPDDEALPGRHREPVLKRGVDLVEAALINGVCAGLDHLRHRLL